MLQANVDSARDDAVRCAIEYFCNPISPIPQAIMLSPSGNSSLPASPKGFGWGEETPSGRTALSRRPIPTATSVASPASAGMKGASPRLADGAHATGKAGLIGTWPSDSESAATQSSQVHVPVRRAQSAVALMHRTSVVGSSSALDSSTQRGPTAQPPLPPSHSAALATSLHAGVTDARRASSHMSRVPSRMNQPSLQQEPFEAVVTPVTQGNVPVIETGALRPPSALTATAAGSDNVHTKAQRSGVRFDSAIEAAVSRALASLAGDARTLRDACAALCNTLMVAHAVDSRSLLRAYGDRIPHEICAPPQPQTAADQQFGAGGTGGNIPIVCEVDVTAAQALDKQLRNGAVGSLILSCLRHSHENVQADGLALLCALADTTLDVSSPAVDELSDVIFGSVEEAARASSVVLGGADAAGYATSLPDLPVRMTSLTVSTNSGEASRVQVVTVVPVYALGLMQGGVGTKVGAGSGVTPGAGVIVSGAGPGTLFREIYASLVFLTTVTAEAQRSPGKRAVAALRRACPVSSLLSCTLSTLSNPSAEQRSLWSALMLAYSMLGEPGML